MSAPNAARPQTDETCRSLCRLAVPWLAGERVVAVEWVSPVYDQFTKDVPTPGKGK